MHEIMMLETSRVRANPASKNMNPACMKNTRKAVTRTQIVLIGLITSSVLRAGVVCPSMVAPALVLKYQVIAQMASTVIPRPTIFPLK